MKKLDWEIIWAGILSKLDEIMPEMQGVCPSYTTKEGKYQGVRADDWTSGFWPGMLWIAYEMTGQERFRDAAWPYDEEIEGWMVKANNFVHDVGFQFLNTAVMKAMLTGDEEGERRGIAAAHHLAGRYNPAGQFLRAWRWDGDTGWAIIDCMMNLSILFWASEQTGDPRYRHIAIKHADTALETFIRADGSVIHIASFDPESGAFVESLGGQGYGPDSAWSRGQAWALYGFANMHRFTGDRKYLDAAKRVAHYFMANLPEDGVPYWDFRIPSFEGAARDSSAGAIAASGLIEIAEQVPALERELYDSAADRILLGITRQCATFEQPEHQSLLTYATGNLPHESNIEVGLIFGDYYYMEAVAKRMGWKRKIY